MAYTDYLTTNEWYNKCSTILKRDNHSCQNCGTKGYHNSSPIHCSNKEEFDKILSHITIDGKSVSHFVLEQYEMSTSYKELVDTFIERQNNNIYSVSAYYSLSSPADISLLFGDLHNNVFVKTENDITNSKIKGITYWTEKKHKVIDIEKSNWKFEHGSIYKLNKIISDDFVVMIERIWPRHGYEISNPTEIIMWGDIVVSISYKELCISLVFNEKTNDPSDFTFPSSYVKSLNIHHKYYIENHLPWDYEDDALITLCAECHQLKHQKEKIPVYRDHISPNNISRYADICSKCGGSGYIPQYIHVENGICFQCHGEGVII